MYYYHADHLGTPQALTDEQGQLALEMDYQAWGEAREVIAEAAASADIRNPFRFQGQYHDDESGLHYNRHRYYDPEIGRFISRDPIGLLGDINIHSYAPNPVEWIDPLGLARIAKSTKQKVQEENASFFGRNRCEACGTPTVPAQKSQRGVTPPHNETQYDHIEADAKGGSNTEENVQLLCRKCNRKFSDNEKDNYKILNRNGCIGGL